MRILLDERLIFISNPKTGSTSIRNYLDSLKFKNSITSTQEFPLYHHSSAEELNHYYFKYSNYKFKDFTSFCFVRNPWKRAISNYLYSKPDINFNPFYNLNYDPKTQYFHAFNEWVKKVLNTNQYTFESYQFSRVKNSRPFILDSLHLLVPIKWIAFDRYQKQLLTKIYKLEELEGEVVPFLKKYLNKQKVVLPKENTTYNFGNLDLRFDLESAELVHKHFLYEINEFNYSFNGRLKEKLFKL